MNKRHFQTSRNDKTMCRPKVCSLHIGPRQVLNLNSVLPQRNHIFFVKSVRIDVAWGSCKSSIGRVFRPPLWRWRKMAALPLPVAILDDLISGSRKWGHPRWRPEAEGPPSCATATIGVEKLAPGPGWRHFRPRHLGSKMATVEMTSRGRRDAREDVLQTSAPSMSPVEVWLYWKHLIVSLTQALSKWLSELPACYYAEVISLHMSKVMKNLRLQQAPTLLFFWFYFFIFFNCTLQ